MKLFVLQYAVLILVSVLIFLLIDSMTIEEGMVVSVSLLALAYVAMLVKYLLKERNERNAESKINR
jgi:membrane protein implicated in regulation of membrane protease activity